MRSIEHLKARIGVRMALRGIPEARALKLGAVLGVTEGAEVLAARFNGLPAILKRHIGPKAAARAGTLADALAVQHPLMAEPDRVPEPFLALPGRGIVVMERAGGEPLDAAIRRVPERRAALIRRAGHWLRSYTAAGRIEDAFGGGYWVKRRTGELEGRDSDPDRARLAGLIALMDAERAQIGARPITRARSHGDFAPQNLFVDGDTLWGIGIKGGGWLAIAKDLARFLVGLEITLPHGAADGPCGFAAADTDALLGTPGLIRAGEAEVMMPFFAAVELSGQLLDSGLTPTQRDNARALADRMLDEAQIGVA